MGPLTLTSVRVSDDLSIARVNFVPLGGEGDTSEILEASIRPRATSAGSSGVASACGNPTAAVAPRHPPRQGHGDDRPPRPPHERARGEGGGRGSVVRPCFLVIDKEPGITSHDVVAMVRAALGIKKVGHTGTLDPFATGVLPLAVGPATRLIQYLDEDLKVYDATIQLGVQTDTGDHTGAPIAEAPVPP